MAVTFAEMTDRAMVIRELYVEHERARYGRTWSASELALGFVGDVGDLAKLVLADAGVRDIPDHRDKLAHELADCLWSVIVLAQVHRIDLAAAFSAAMGELEEQLR